MRTISQEEIDLSLALKAGGKSAREIGKILGVSTRAVYTRINPAVRERELLKKRSQFVPKGRPDRRGPLNPAWKGGDVFTCTWCGKKHCKIVKQGGQKKHKKRYCNRRCYAMGRGHSTSRDPKERRYDMFLWRMARSSLNKELNCGSKEYGQEIIVLRIAYERAIREFKRITGRNIQR